MWAWPAKRRGGSRLWELGVEPYCCCCCCCCCASDDSSSRRGSSDAASGPSCESRASGGIAARRSGAREDTSVRGVRGDATGRLLPDIFVSTRRCPHKDVGQLRVLIRAMIAPGSDNRAPWGPAQKARIHQRINHETAVIHAECPETYGLGERQLETRHLLEVGANLVNDSSEAHAPRGEQPPSQLVFSRLSARFATILSGF